jgi:hypothetical protein
MKTIAAVVTVSFILAVPAMSEDHREDYRKVKKAAVYALDNSGWPGTPPVFIPLPGEWASLNRNSDHVTVEFRLRNLNPAWVYNAHIWIFNNPGACIASPGRGARCAPLVDQFILETEASLVSFGGFIPERSGDLHVEVALKVSEGMPAAGFFGTNGTFTNVVNGPGLTNPKGAEIQFDLALKGAVQKDMTVEQFQMMFGACGPGFTLPPLNPNQLCEVIRESAVGGTQ